MPYTIPPNILKKLYSLQIRVVKFADTTGQISRYMWSNSPKYSPVDPHFAKFTYLSYILLIIFIALLVFDTLNFLFDFKYPKLSFLINTFKQFILLLLIIYVFSLIAIDYVALEENEKRYIPNFAITCTTASFYFASFLAYLGFSLYKFTNLDQLANEVIVK